MAVDQLLLEALMTDRIYGEAVEEIYGAQHRGEDMREAAHSIAKRIAPLCVAQGLRFVCAGHDQLSGLLTVGTLRDFALQLDGHA